jgi:hypothetical protein
MSRNGLFKRAKFFYALACGERGWSAKAAQPSNLLMIAPASHQLAPQ